MATHLKKIKRIWFFSSLSFMKLFKSLLAQFFGYSDICLTKATMELKWSIQEQTAIWCESSSSSIQYFKTRLKTYFYSLAFESVWFAFISLAPTTMYLTSFLSIPLFIFIYSVFFLNKFEHLCIEMNTILKIPSLSFNLCRFKSLFKEQCGSSKPFWNRHTHCMHRLLSW